MMAASIARRGFLDVQVCVPVDWSDDQVLDFAQTEYPCGTTNGWAIRREGSPFLLAGDPERCPCQDLPGHVHITLDA